MEKVPSFRENIREQLRAIPSPTGANIETKVLAPEEIYRQTQGFPPDLLVYFGNLDYRSSGLVGLDTIYLPRNDTGIDDANHDFQGVFIWRPSKGIRASSTKELTIYDVAPTVLDSFGLQIPKDMIGRSLISR